MTEPFQEDEEELLIADPMDDETEIGVDDIDDREVTLEDVKVLEEEDNLGHKLQTYDATNDGTDNYFDEKYFDE